jgi:hypothetical protein
MKGKRGEMGRRVQDPAGRTRVGSCSITETRRKEGLPQDSGPAPKPGP